MIYSEECISKSEIFKCNPIHFLIYSMDDINGILQGKSNYVGMDSPTQ